MKKYKAILKTIWQRQLTYRANMMVFRIGNLIELGFELLIWQAIFDNTVLVGGYDKKEMLTYITLTWLFSFFTATYGSESIVSGHVKDGKLSEFLVKPVSYLRYMTVYSLGRSSMASIFGVFIVLGFMAIFHKILIFPTSIITIAILLIMLILGTIIRTLLSILVGIASFWTDEVTGVTSTLNTIIKFLSGSYAPLNLLPKAFYIFTLWTPFVYITFFPAQIYLGKVNTIQGIYGIMIEIAWLIILYYLTKLLWLFGVKKYEASGN